MRNAATARHRTTADSRTSLPLVFVHIPKAAGTALRIGLENAINADVSHVCFDTSMLGGHHPEDIASPRMRSRLMVCAEDYPARADLVSGHFSPTITRARYAGARHMTVLREGRSRLLSAWLFYRMFSNRGVARWGHAARLLTAARQPLTTYLADPIAASRTDNASLRQLVWPHPLVPDSQFIDPAHDEELLQTALASLRQMDFVGLVEEPDLPGRLSEWLRQEVRVEHYDHPGRPPRRHRVDVSASVTDAAELIAERTRLDRELWRRYAAEVLPGHDPDEVADASWQRAVDRHARQQAELPGPALPARLADLAWNAAHLGGKR